MTFKEIGCGHDATVASDLLMFWHGKNFGEPSYEASNIVY